MSAFSAKFPIPKTVVGDAIIWDPTLMPGSKAGTLTRKDDQLWRCKRHKRIYCNLLQSLPPSAAFLDVGAHLGDTVMTVALHAKALGRSDIRFFAFEPSKAKCDFIRETARLNGVSVTVFQTCVGDVCRQDLVRRLDGARSTSCRKDNLVDKYDGRVVYVVKGEKGCGGNYDESVKGSGDNETSVEEHGGNDDNTGEDGDDDDLVDRETRGNASVASAAAAATTATTDDDSDCESSSSEADENLNMINLDSLYETLHPVGFFHLDVEGWESRVISGAKFLLSAVSSTTYLVAEVWEDKNARIGRDGVLTIRGFSPTPIKDIEGVMKDHEAFVRGEDIMDQERNLFYSAFASAENGRRRHYEVYYPLAGVEGDVKASQSSSAEP